MNNRLRELSVLDLARFTGKLKQAQADITELKKQSVPGVCNLIFMEVDEKDNIVDLMGQPLEHKGKAMSESDEKRSL